MASHKARILAMCKQIAVEHGWQFISGKFVKKINKDAHYIIAPNLSFKGGYFRFEICGEVKLPQVVKMVDSISHLKQSIGFKSEIIFSESLDIIHTDSLTKGYRSITLEGEDASSDELIAQEIARWLTVAGNHMESAWPIDDYTKLFEVMKQSSICYRGLSGTALCCLAAYLGKFDFIDYFYSDEHGFQRVEFDATDENLLAVLPDWQAQWQATGKIKV
ncbi:hypothetical protein J7384_06505 [Endozoicomonas sp. G2_1]|uniref:hypothetical protein n=1 Tax=Endozoicomonas sp. G2_1 TaxID=2821091 RepID=UPI001ADBE9FF|nr:hypothetical protein [Endozoicomonas sp. G2_1]MBO9490009.1 hypothetical protein [Endozoicomonas sp. G2_1]